MRVAFVQPDRSNNAGALRKLAATLHRRQMLDRAAETTRRAGNSDLHVDLGVILRTQRRAPEAIAPCREAPRLKGGHAEARHDLGVMLAAIEQRAEAVAACNEHVDHVGDERPPQVPGLREQRKALSGAPR